MNSIPVITSFFRFSTGIFLHWLAPRSCAVCTSLIGEENNVRICSSCYASLPPAPPPEELYDGVAKHFSGDELMLSGLFALYSLKESDDLHHAIHALKYRGKAGIGVELGKELGATLQHIGINNFSAIVPVPLHAARKRERGYNQAERIAQGVSAVMNIPIREEFLQRIRYTQTQTKLSAAARSQNMSGVFTADKRALSDLSNARILLIDDVLTTGSTLNHCARALLDFGAASVHAATIAAA